MLVRIECNPGQAHGSKAKGIHRFDPPVRIDPDVTGAGVLAIDAH